MLKLFKAVFFCWKYAVTLCHYFEQVWANRKIKEKYFMLLESEFGFLEHDDQIKSLKDVKKKQIP